MDDGNTNRLIMAQAGKRFGSHEVLRSKYDPKIPASAEREYVRLTNAYVGIVKEALEEQLPVLKEAYRKERDAAVREAAGMRNDSATDLMLAAMRIFNEMKNWILARTSGFGLRRKLEEIAHLTRKLTVKEWKRAVHATLGVDIREDYYLGDFFEEHLQKWIDYNVGLIRSIPEDTLEKMREIIYDGFADGKSTARVAREIREAYGVSRKKAQFLARDQISKLNGQIAQAQQEDAGIKEYTWKTCQDERVRQGHKKLEGKRFSWDAPPVVDERSGRRCHPQQDYNCRCFASPIFTKSVNLPLADDTNNNRLPTGILPVGILPMTRTVGIRGPSGDGL